MKPGRPLIRLVIMSCLFAGCSEASGPTPEAELATVHGVVKFKGKPVVKGLIRFEATGAGRSPQLQSAPIAANGTYSAKTLIGPNTVTFVLAEAAKAGLSLADVKLTLDAKPGDNVFDAELPPP
jgi:hypothetical protein